MLEGKKNNSPVNRFFSKILRLNRLIDDSNDAGSDTSTASFSLEMDQFLAETDLKKKVHLWKRVVVQKYAISLWILFDLYGDGAKREEVGNRRKGFEVFCGHKRCVERAIQGPRYRQTCEQLRVWWSYRAFSFTRIRRAKLVIKVGQDTLRQNNRATHKTHKSPLGAKSRLWRERKRNTNSQNEQS